MYWYLYSSSLLVAVLATLLALYTWRKRTAVHTIVRHLDDGLLLVTANGQIEDVNRGMAEFLQSQPESLVSRSVTAVFPELATCRDEADDSTTEFTHADKTYRLSRTPLPTQHAKAQREIITLQDVTKQRTEARVRDELTSTMVHDLRSPISNSLAALTMLQRDLQDTLSGDSQLLLEMTVTNTEKTLQLVNQILELNRLENEQMPLEMTAVSLPELVATVVESQWPMAVAQAVRLETAFGHNLPAVFADRLMLERVLQNLVDNGIKASPKDGVVTIEAKREANRLLVAVVDEGAGVPDELKTAVFDKFTTGQTGGSGLGLAFCKMTLQAHQQSIWFENRPDGGAAFFFTLPLAPSF